VYSEKWSPGLRQGDLFGEVPFPFAKKSFAWITTGGLGQTLLPQSAQVEAQPRYAMVLSHDCEFNEGKRTHFLVARVESLSKSLTSDELEALRAGNDVESAADQGRPVALDTFVVDPIEHVFAEFRRVNFAAAVSFPMDMTDYALDCKKAELLQEHRVRLRRKLSYFFGREADDIPEDDKKPAPSLAPATEQPTAPT